MALQVMMSGCRLLSWLKMSRACLRDRCFLQEYRSSSQPRPMFVGKGRLHKPPISNRQVAGMGVAMGTPKTWDLNGKGENHLWKLCTYSIHTCSQVAGKNQWESFLVYLFKNLLGLSGSCFNKALAPFEGNIQIRFADTSWLNCVSRLTKL